MLVPMTEKTCLPCDAEPRRTDVAVPRGSVTVIGASGNLLATARSLARQSAWLMRQPMAFRDDLVARAVVSRFSRGEMIIGLEDTGGSLCFLVSGAVQVSVPRADLEVVPVHVISPLEWFGEYGVATGAGSLAEFKAQTPCVVLTIPRGEFLVAVAKRTEFSAAVTDLLAQAVRSSFEIAAGLSGLGPDARVRSKLHTLCGSGRCDGEGRSVIAITQEELAAVACVSRSVVWKVLSQLSQKGAITLGYRRIVVINRDTLLEAEDA